MCESIKNGEIESCKVGMFGDFDIMLMDNYFYKYCKFNKLTNVCERNENYLHYDNQNILFKKNNKLIIISLTAKRNKKFNISELNFYNNDLIVKLINKKDDTINYLSLKTIFKVNTDDHNELITMDYIYSNI